MREIKLFQLPGVSTITQNRAGCGGIAEGVWGTRYGPPQPPYEGGERGVSEIEMAPYSPLAKHPEHSEGHEVGERGVRRN